MGLEFYWERVLYGLRFNWSATGGWLLLGRSTGTRKRNIEGGVTLENNGNWEMVVIWEKVGGSKNRSDVV